MSAKSIEKARTAVEYVKVAKQSAREAKKILEDIGDKDGGKLAKDIEEAAEKTKEYVEKRLGVAN